MTVKGFSEENGFSPIVLADPDREICGVYVGDLLSWVMGRCPEEVAWITIMSNQNVAAVAVLCDPACVILSEGVEPDAELLEKAGTSGVNLLGSDLDEFQLCWKIHELIG